MMVLILARMPIAAAMAIVGVLGSAALAGWSAALATLKQGPFERATSYTLVVVPLFVLYGILTEQSIGKLLMAGILPGLVETVLFIIAIAIVAAVWPTLGAAGPRATWRERLGAVRDVWEVIVLFLIVIGGIYVGLATPAESAAFGVMGALVLRGVHRTVGWRELPLA